MKKYSYKRKRTKQKKNKNYKKSRKSRKRGYKRTKKAGGIFSFLSGKRNPGILHSDKGKMVNLNKPKPQIVVASLYPTTSEARNSMQSLQIPNTEPEREIYNREISNVDDLNRQEKMRLKELGIILPYKGTWQTMFYVPNLYGPNPFIGQDGIQKWNNMNVTERRIALLKLHLERIDSEIKAVSASGLSTDHLLNERSSIVQSLNREQGNY